MSTAAPTSLKITPGVESLALSWGVSGEGLGGFLVHWRPQGTTTWSTVELPETVRSYVITGLVAENYEVQVRALIAGGLASSAASPLPKASAVPVLRLEGDTISWAPVPGALEYLFATVLDPSTTRETTYVTLAGTSITPPAVPGQTVNYGCRVESPAASAWAQEVAITYPKAEESKEEPTAMVIAMDTGGWPGSYYADFPVKHVRVQSSYVARDSSAATAAGVDYSSVIFGTGGTIGAIDQVSYAAEVKALCEKWPGQIKAVEVLNEPGGSWFWSDPTNYTAYTALLKATHEALATLPNRPAILASWDGGSVEGAPGKFGPGVKRAGGYTYCDGVTVHPYGGSDGGAGGALGNRPMIEAAHKETGLPVYITEVGWPTAVGKPPTGDSQQWTEAQQAQNIESLIAWCRTQGYIANLTVFQWADYKGSGSNPAYAWYGVVKEDGATRKPSYAVLQRP